MTLQPILPSNPLFQVFDPRRGESYSVKTSEGKTISTLEQNLFVIRYYRGRKDSPLKIQDFNDLIRIAMEQTGSLGFLSSSPFTKELQEYEILEQCEIEEISGSVIGYFRLESLEIDRHLNLRLQTSYQEWNIGSCQSHFVKPEKPSGLHKAIYWDAGYLFSQLGNIGCLSIFVGETGELIVVTRIFPRLDELLAPLKERADRMIRRP